MKTKIIHVSNGIMVRIMEKLDQETTAKIRFMHYSVGQVMKENDWQYHLGEDDSIAIDTTISHSISFEDLSAKVSEIQAKLRSFIKDIEGIPMSNPVQNADSDKENDADGELQADADDKDDFIEVVAYVPLPILIPRHG